MIIINKDADSVLLNKIGDIISGSCGKFVSVIVRDKFVFLPVGDDSLVPYDDIALMEGVIKAVPLKSKYRLISNA